MMKTQQARPARDLIKLQAPKLLGKTRAGRKMTGTKPQGIKPD